MVAGNRIPKQDDPLAVGGISLGAIIGASRAQLVGTVHNLNGGALLALVSGRSILNLRGPSSLGLSVTQLRLRINDADFGLGDNSGRMTACFR